MSNKKLHDLFSYREINFCCFQLSTKSRALHFVVNFHLELLPPSLTGTHNIYGMRLVHTEENIEAKEIAIHKC